MKKAKKVKEVEVNASAEDYGFEEAKVGKVAPLELNLAGQLGQENLALVVAKLNEVIAHL